MALDNLDETSRSCIDDVFILKQQEGSHSFKIEVNIHLCSVFFLKLNRKRQLRYTDEFEDIS